MPEAYALEFSFPYLGIQSRLTRGKDYFRGSATGSFQWTSAVRAFLVHVVRLAAARSHSPGLSEAITGKGLLDDRESALTLEYAIDRTPEWLLALFGSDKSGRPLAKRLFRRNSSSRKRGEPVTVELNDAWWSDIVVELFWNGKPVDELDIHQVIAESLSRRTSGVALGATREDAQSDVDVDTLFDRMLPSYEQIAREGLAAGEIFSEKRLRDLAASLTESRIFRRYAGAGVTRLSQIRTTLSGSYRLGCDVESAVRLLADQEPLSIMIPGANFVASVAIGTYLRTELKANVELYFRGVHSVEVVQQIIGNNLERSPELIALAAGSSAELLSKRSEYEPLMFLPRDVQRLVEAGNSSSRRSSEYAVLNSSPSNPLLFQDELLAARTLNPRKDLLRCLEPDESIPFLSELTVKENRRALLFFPHFEVNRIFNRCRLVSVPTTMFANPPTLLWAHKRLIKNKERAEAAEALVRDAWLSLSSRPQTLQRVVRRMFKMTEFRARQQRVAGLHHFLHRFP